jgi:3-hydroxymyristoyl/3-hydroxydecanoyl-(acyl carrier protein) dehydratase
LPRKWRYLSALPLDAQGKKKKLEIQKLFSTSQSAHSHAAHVHGVYEKQILQQTNDSVKLELYIPATSDYFDGHFPDFKVLPAVAQAEIALRFASRYFDTSIFVSSAKRLKFSGIIVPESAVYLQLDYDAEKSLLVFSLSDTKGENIFSSGSLKLDNNSKETSI